MSQRLPARPPRVVAPTPLARAIGQLWRTERGPHPRTLSGTPRPQRDAARR